VPGVRLRWLASLARRAAAADLAEDAGARPALGDDAYGQPLGALPQRQGVVDGGAGLLGQPGAAEGAEIGAAVVTDVAHDRQAGKGLGGELEPQRALRMA
jgi:hypothetical protein